MNLAQRLEANAEPGGILIGERTRGLLPEDFEVDEAKRIRVKGIEDEVVVYPVRVDEP